MCCSQYKVLSIDVGIIHLGLSMFNIDHDFNIQQLERVDLINITQFSHNHVSRKECTLYHNKTISDWMEHVFQDNMYFYESDYILIERQPPQGHTVVEQMIFNKFRNKVILISPNSVHKYLGISHLDYDSRKKESEYILQETLESYSTKVSLNSLEKFDRLHDIGDSVCMFLYWIDSQKKELKKQKRKEKFQKMMSSYDKSKNVTEWFESFRHHVKK